MYLLFKFHHIKPSEFYAMGEGERRITFAFLEREMKERVDEYNAMGGG